MPNTFEELDRVVLDQETITKYVEYAIKNNNIRHANGYHYVNIFDKCVRFNLTPHKTIRGLMMYTDIKIDIINVILPKDDTMRKYILENIIIPPHKSFSTIHNDSKIIVDCKSHRDKILYTLKTFFDIGIGFNTNYHTEWCMNMEVYVPTTSIPRLFNHISVSDNIKEIDEFLIDMDISSVR